MSEKAVGEYYIGSGYRLTPNSREIPFDFIAVKGEESIGVEIKTTSMLKLHLATLNTISRFSSIWADFQKTTQLARIRLVFVVTDYNQEEPIKKLLEHLGSFRKNLYESIDIHIGKLDEENKYISLFELTIDNKD